LTDVLILYFDIIWYLGKRSPKKRFLKKRIVAITASHRMCHHNTGRIWLNYGCMRILSIILGAIPWKAKTIARSFKPKKIQPYYSNCGRI